MHNWKKEIFCSKHSVPVSKKKIIINFLHFFNFFLFGYCRWSCLTLILTRSGKILIATFHSSWKVREENSGTNGAQGVGISIASLWCYHDVSKGSKNKLMSKILPQHAITVTARNFADPWLPNCEFNHTSHMSNNKNTYKTILFVIVSIDMASCTKAHQ